MISGGVGWGVRRKLVPAAELHASPRSATSPCQLERLGHKVSLRAESRQEVEKFTRAILGFRRFDTASLTLGRERVAVTCGVPVQLHVLGHDLVLTAPSRLRRRVPSTR